MTDSSSDKWAMPKPVFRSSTGELVVPSEHVPVDPEPDTLEPIGIDTGDDPLSKLYAPPEGHVAAPDPTASTETAPHAIQVEEQPDLTDVLIEPELKPEPSVATPKERGPALYILGAIFFIAVASAFIYLVYFLFFATRPDGSGL